MFDVSNKIFCITGASSGIGQALATAMANKGASVVAVARRTNALKQWHEQTQGKTAFVSADLTEIDHIETIAQDICEQFGPIDVLINAAGLNPRQHADNISPKTWSQTIDINLSAPFFLAQALINGMKSKSWGRIINFASLQSQRAFENGIAYGAAKGGVPQMTRAMAQAWSHYGITANAIAPGFFPTELTAPVFNDPLLSQKNAEQTCIGRNGTMQDLIGPVQFFCSDASNYVTGQTLFVDGGFTAK